MNYKLIGTQIGDLLKYDTTINEINRIAKATFNFDVSNFPNDSITSERAQIIYNWVMTLATKKMNNAALESVEKYLQQPGLESDMDNLLVD